MGLSWMGATVIGAITSSLISAGADGRGGASDMSSGDNKAAICRTALTSLADTSTSLNGSLGEGKASTAT
jgi:hypothetical protein